MITSKERMQIIMEHKEADRVPYMMRFSPEAELLLEKKYEREIKSINWDNEIAYRSIGKLDILFNHDMLIFAYGMSTGYYMSDEEIYIDKWRIKWRRVPYDCANGVGYYTEIVEFPLADEDKIGNYTPPNPDNEDMSLAEEVINRFGKEKYICGAITLATFETLKYLRGITQSLIDIIQNKDIANLLMDMSADYHIKLGCKLIDKGVDILWLADDIGGEHQMLISPEIFREMIKPKIGRMIGEFKKRNKNIKIAFHSDGYIEPIIDDLIEIGVDLLNPIQPESMDPSYIKKRYGNKIALWGTVSTQLTFPLKGPEDVDDEVKERVRTCAPGGGFLIAPAHNIQLDVPLENVEAFYNAVEKYGKYPIML